MTTTTENHNVATFVVIVVVLVGGVFQWDYWKGQWDRWGTPRVPMQVTVDGTPHLACAGLTVKQNEGLFSVSFTDAQGMHHQLDGAKRVERIELPATVCRSTSTEVK